MKIEKCVLNEALRVLSKVVCLSSPVEAFRQIRFVGSGNRARLCAADGVELVALTVPCEAEGAFDFGIELRRLRELVRDCKTKSLELNGSHFDWPKTETVPADAVTVELPPDFCKLLALAAPVVDRREARPALQGINLSRDGVTATNGKELLNLPCLLTIPEDVTLPFPLAFLTAKPEGAGTLYIWRSRNERLFRLEIGNICWQGKAQPGNFPNWKQAIPAEQSLDYQIEFREPERVIAFLKTVPDHEPFHGIELNVTPEGVTLIPVDTPAMKLDVCAEVTGVRPRAVLALNKHILLRMLQQGYTKFRAHSDGRVPVVATGGCGQYVAMPIHILPKQPIEKEIQTMETNPSIETTETAPEPVNPMEDLNHSIDELRGKLRTLFDESALLSRKVKEAVLQQKQREREFVQAKRAIERIRMAI